uniref:Integrase catalytic domain-containing protein n=1 Tax=Tanacetum cinerariifolium TaxID=118510 RepID=A0A699GJP6_TANCI|nr:hypothetical protein [Tanacetum cinerariifolium]
MALPEDHLAKFHKMTDAKKMWETIKSRFGGNNKSKKMQNYLLKQQFEGFSVSNSEGLHKEYDRSLPTSWSQVALIMRTKPCIDTLNFDDLYNNLRVFERDVKCTSASSSNIQNVAFVSAESTSSTNEVAMISMRIKKFHKRTGRKLQFDAKEPVGFDMTKVECFNCHKIRHFARDYRSKGNQDSRRRDAGYNGNKARENGRRPENQDDSKALITIDGDDIDWSRHVEEDKQNYVMMAYSSSNSGSDSKVKSYSKACEESYAKLKKLHDDQREKLGDASVEITAYTLALKKVEAQLVCHQQNQIAYEEKIRFMRIDLDDKTDVLAYHKKLLAEALKEKEELKTKLENWQNSSKNLGKLLNTQMSANDKFGLGDLEDRPMNDRFVKTDGMHTVPPPMIGNYMPFGPHVEMDYSKFTYGPKQIKVDESDAKTSEYASCESDSSVDTPKSVPKPVENEPNVSCKSKVCFSHLIRDCDFHEKRMAKQVELNKSKDKAILTNTGRLLVNTARQNFSSQAASTSTARKVNTARTFVNETRPKSNFYKSYSPFKRPFNSTTAPKTNISNQKDNTVGNKSVSAIEGNGETAVKASADCNWRSKTHYWNKVSKYNSGSKSRKWVNIKDPLGRLKFSWVYFLRSKDETTPILKDFIRQAENQFNHTVKTFRSHNGTEFKNKELIELCGLKRIKREYINARTPQQNGVANRKNRTLIEATRTMLVDSFLPTTFWAEAVNTACYVLNRVLVTKPQNTTPYELLTGTPPLISYIRPFGCHVTILNTIDQLGKFDGKSDSGFLVGYSLNSKAFRVYNLETKRIEENLHVNFLENKPNVLGKGHAWMFDLDYLTNSMKYKPVTAENQANKSAGPKEANNSADDNIAKATALKICKKPVSQVEQVFLEELKRLKRQEKEANDAPEVLRKEAAHDSQDASTSSTNLVNTASTPISTDSPSREFSVDELSYYLLNDPSMPNLEDIHASPSDGIFAVSSYDDDGIVTNFNNLETPVNINPTPTTRIHSMHLKTQILKDPKSAVQTRSKVKKNSKAHAFVSYIQKKQRINHKDFQHCLFACFLSQIEPKKISKSLKDESWAIGTKWVYKNKTDERGLVVRNKARLVVQGHRQEEGIDYDEVFALVARIEAIMIFLAFASYMGFIVYQIDVKSAFLYGTIDEEVYVSQPSGFVDPKYPQKVYKVVKALYGLHQGFRAWYVTLSTFLLKNRYIKGTIDNTLFIKKDKKDIMLVKQKEDGIFISQDKYVAEILKKFDFMSVKTASTPVDTKKPLTKDEEAADVDVHLYRSMIGSLMYLTASRPDIMFAVCACSSDYAGANLDRKSTTGGCQFLGRRLISWQCKKQTTVVTSTIEADEPFDDVYTTPAHNLKVFSNMSRKELKFSGKITPLFPNMLIQAKGEGLGEPTEPQPTPSPTYPSTGDHPPMTESSSIHATTQDSSESLEGTNRSERDQVQSPMIVLFQMVTHLTELRVP